MTHFTGFLLCFVAGFFLICPFPWVLVGTCVAMIGTAMVLSKEE